MKLTSERHRKLLRANPNSNDGHVFESDRFEVVEEIDRGTPILVIDDTFTMGTRVQAAASL